MGAVTPGVSVTLVDAGQARKSVNSVATGRFEFPAVAPVRVGGSVRVPRKLTDVRPVYPASMQNAGMTGTVPLEAVIGRDGSVTSVRVASAQVHPDLATAAIDAVRQWRFSPTLLNGVPVEVMMTVTVNFDLGG